MSKLWMYQMPHLAGDIFLNEAEKMNIMIHGQMATMSPQQWDDLEENCRKRLGWHERWKEVRYHKMMQQIYATGWGDTVGPKVLHNFSADSPSVKIKYHRKKQRGIDTEQGSLLS